MLTHLISIGAHSPLVEAPRCPIPADNVYPNFLVDRVPITCYYIGIRYYDIIYYPLGNTWK